MVELFGTAAPLTSDINFLIQIAILASLFYGYFIVKKFKFIRHGYLMFLGASVNLFSLIFVMLPNALAILSGASLTLFTVTVVFHAILGAVVEAWGIYIIAMWRFRVPGPPCSRLRTQMKKLFIFWLAVAVSGFVLYVFLYV
jgi:hypothetical protein